MPLSVSSADLKAALPASVGDTGMIATNLNTIWGMFDDKATIDIRLQFFYAKREALRWRAADLANKVNIRIGGMMIDYASMARAVKDMLAEVDEDIAGFQGSSTDSMPASQQISRTAPIQGTDQYTIGQSVDANDVGLQGNPYVGSGVFPFR